MLGKVELLERHAELAELEEAFERATVGPGCLVLVSGEAGAGKTSLVRQFGSQVASRGRVLWGLCDDLLTPRPLGPVGDIADQVGGHLRQAVVDGSTLAASSALLYELDGPPHPAVAVLEDMHWADEATFEVIQYVGRRIDRVRAMLVMTCRDDEAVADHPLRRVLASVSREHVLRVQLNSLSPRAVARLAGRSDVDDLYALTKGNPFFVTEVLSGEGASVPASVQDAVMARVSRLGAHGRETVELVSVVPGRVELGVIDVCDAATGVDDALRAGLLEIDDHHAAFRHELARQAVESGLGQGRRRDLNGRVLSALMRRRTEPSRLTHHAVQADDAKAVSQFAPEAARTAAAADSHHEAVEHFEQALARADLYSDSQLADLLDECGRECYFAGLQHRAEDVLTRAVELHAAADNVQRLGVSLCLLSDTQWFLGHGEAAAETVDRAIQTLVDDGEPSAALAHAYAQRAKLAMVDRRVHEAITWGEKAVDLARSLGDTEVLLQALNTVGSARWMVPPFDNGQLIESLELARSEQLSQPVGRAYFNLADGYLYNMRYDEAERYISEGLAYCEAHDLLTSSNHLLAARGWLYLECGRWSEVEPALERPIAGEDVSKITALRVLGLLQARRGDLEAGETLAQAHELSEKTTDVQSRLPTASARAEFAWLTGELDSVKEIAHAALERATQPAGRWIDELLLWLHRSGGDLEGQPAPAGPQALQIAGRWREAADAWGHLGRPYEAADAMADAPNPETLLEALERLDRLGAAASAAIVRRRLTGMGVASVPRGPRQAARSSPAGLTQQQTNVLRLLNEGLTYEQIARRMHLSVKTVDHHLAAVRTKLGVHTRDEAIAEGRRLGIMESRPGMLNDSS